MFKKLFLLCVLSILSLVCHGQIVSMNIIASADGIRNGAYYTYTFQRCHKDKGIVRINLNDSIVYVDSIKYSIITTPEHWHIRRTYKWCSFLCCDDRFNKVCVKLFRYDGSNHSKIYIFENNIAYKFLGLE